MWAVWWIAALVAPLLPTGVLTESHGGRLWVLATCIGALSLSAVTRSRREVRFGWLTLIVLIGCAWEAWRIAQLPEVIPWLFRWGAWWDVAGWWLLGLSGTMAVVRHAPSGSRWLPPALCLILSFNLLAAWLERFGFSRWAFVTPPHLGLFANQVEWAAWCAISLPVLWAWRRWASLPAALGLLVSPTSSAFLAIGVWLWCVQRGVLRKTIATVLVLVGIWWQEPLFRACVMMRLDTWVAVVKTILDHPDGIGWGFGAYQLVAEHATTPILPHPASDVLMLPLRYGWWTVFVVLGLWWWTSAPRGAWIPSIKVAMLLGCWQTSVSLPTVGALVWVLWMAETIRRHDGEERQIEIFGADCPTDQSFTTGVAERTTVSHVRLRGGEAAARGGDSSAELLRESDDF